MREGFVFKRLSQCQKKKKNHVRISELILPSGSGDGSFGDYRVQPHCDYWLKGSKLLRIMVISVWGFVWALVWCLARLPHRIPYLLCLSVIGHHGDRSIKLLNPG